MSIEVSSESKSAISKQHYLELDGLRGIAILSVMVFHFFYFGHIKGKTTLGNFLINIINMGWGGVDLFFVLSGFLITGILFDSKKQQYFFHKFYWRRVLRIFPLYYLFLTLAFFIFPRFDTTNTFSIISYWDQIWCWGYFSNIRIALQGWNTIAAPLQHFWSLAIEEQFYFIWPFVVYMLSRERLLLLCVCIFFLALSIRIFLSCKGYWYSAYVFMPARLDPLATGAFIALLLRGASSCKNVIKWVKLIIVLSSLSIITVFCLRNGLHIRDPLVVAVCPSLFSLLFGGILILGIFGNTGSKLKKILTFPVFTFFGKYSYALYIFHQPIAIYLYTLGSDSRTLNQFPQSLLVSPLIYFLTAFFCSVITAFVSWHFFEKHFLKLKDKYIFLPKA